MRHIIAGAAVLPTPNPTMATGDSAAANTILATLVKNGGNYNAWNNAEPFTSGDEFGYWRVWPNSAGTGKVKLWESEECMWITISTSSGSNFQLVFFCADPESTDAADSESDGKVYGMAVSGGTSASDQASHSAAANVQCMWGHFASNGNAHCGCFTPRGSSIVTTASWEVARTIMTASGTKTRSGNYVRLPMSLRQTATAPSDTWFARLREIYRFSDAQSGQKQGNSPIVSTGDGVNADAWILGS
jgi:hypothetical protein